MEAAGEKSSHRIGYRCKGEAEKREESKRHWYPSTTAELVQSSRQGTRRVAQESRPRGRVTLSRWASLVQRTYEDQALLYVFHTFHIIHRHHNPRPLCRGPSNVTPRQGPKLGPALKSKNTSTEKLQFTLRLEIPIFAPTEISSASQQNTDENHARSPTQLAGVSAARKFDLTLCRQHHARPPPTQISRISDLHDIAPDRHVLNVKLSRGSLRVSPLNPLPPWAEAVDDYARE